MNTRVEAPWHGSHPKSTDTLLLKAEPLRPRYRLG